jgi:TRAP-type C4-dicarboxylate transport system permease small subunit
VNNDTTIIPPQEMPPLEPVSPAAVVHGPQGPLLALRRIDEAIGVVCMAAIVLSITWGVITRYFFPPPAAWSFEAAVIAFGWLVFFGSAACIRWRMHADVDALVAVMPPSWRRAIFIGNWLLLAGLFVVLTAMFVWQSMIAHSIHLVSMNLPRSVVYAPMAVASGLMFVQHLLLAPWRDGWQWRSTTEQGL